MSGKYKPRCSYPCRGNHDKTTPAVIIAAARTAIGTSRKGTLAKVEATELAKPVVAAAIERSGRNPDDFDDLILAEVYQGGGDMARYVAVDLGFTGLPGMAVNRQCASSLTAVALGCGQIAAGMSRAVLAGCVESCSTAPVVRKRKATRSGKDPDDWIDPWYSYSHPPTAQAPAMDTSITVAHNCAVDELRRRGGGIGVVSMCAGGGMGAAMVIEVD